MQVDWPVKTSVNCTPKNARYPVTDLTATAGNERVRLNWIKPNSERFTNYQITVSPSGKVITLMILHWSLISLKD